MLYNHLTILILLKLFFAHIITDFILQPSKWVQSRKEKKYKSIYLYLHGLIAGVLSYLLVAKWSWIAIIPIITIIHTLIDLWKVYQKEKKELYFVLDQLFHIISIIVVWLIFTNQWETLYKKIIPLVNQPKVVGLILGYTLILWPSGILIKELTTSWRKEIEKDAPQNGSLNQAGKWIGYMERFLTLTLILLNQYSAIGFIFAAKSILRLNPSQQIQSKKYTEYILLGTLLSFTITFAIGMFLIYGLKVTK